MSKKSPNDLKLARSMRALAFIEKLPGYRDDEAPDQIWRFAPMRTLARRSGPKSPVPKRTLRPILDKLRADGHITQWKFNRMTDTNNRTCECVDIGQRRVRQRKRRRK